MSAPAEEATPQILAASCIHELIERQVARKPEAPAIILEDGLLTYGEFNRRANRLAHYLRRHDAGLEVLVGVCLDVSLEAAVAALAILKAGAAYVSLPPTDPERRLSEKIRDARIRLVVSTKELSHSILPYATDLVCLDEEGARIDRESTENVLSGVCPDNAAYVRYTSGSTGKPKGVVNIHRCLTNRLMSGTHPDIQGSDVCAARRLGGSRFFSALALGARVVIMDGERFRDLNEFAQTIERNRITSIYVVPSVLRELLRPEFMGTPWMESLRAVTVGGEPLTPEIIDRFRQVAPQAMLINTYGSTEIGTTATLRVVSKSPDASWRSIGQPAGNTDVRILNRHMTLLAPEEVGEICVAAPYLARGYIGQPDLTAKHFVPDPLGSRPGARLYRTGDMGRYSQHGDIEFVGRVDSQVKIRGFRVELGEVEAIVKDHPSVSECVVTTRDLSKDTQLIAYVVCKGGTRPTVSELRDHLYRYLPGHMVPSGFLFVNALPQTAGGTVDRHQMLAFDSLPGELENEYVPPRNETEATLAAIWADVLGLDRIGVEDDFFMLGGESLLAMRIVGRVRERFSTMVTMAEFLESSTIAVLARLMLTRVGQIGAFGPATTSVTGIFEPIQRISRDGPLPVSHQQKSQLVPELYRPDAQGPQGRQPRLAICVSILGELHHHLMEESLNQVVHRHEILRTSYQPTISVGPLQVHGWTAVRNLLRGEANSVDWALSFIQDICPASPVALPLINLERISGGDLPTELEKVTREIDADDFDYGSPPFVRAGLIKTGQTRHFLFATMPHVATDRVSMDVFVREVLSLYEAAKNGYACPVPPLRIQYVDFAEWQQQRIAEVYQTSSSGITCAGCGTLETASVTFTRYSPGKLAGLIHKQVGRETVVIRSLWYQRLRVAAQALRVTVPMLLFAAFAIVLHFSSRKQVIGIMTTQANRGHRDLDELIGFVAAGELICVDFSGDIAVKDLLLHIRDQFSRAADGGGIWGGARSVTQEVASTLFPHNTFLFEVINESESIASRLGLTDLSVNRFPILRNPGPATFGFTLLVEYRRDDALAVRSLYCTDCFYKESVCELLEVLVTLAKAISAPDQTGLLVRDLETHYLCRR